MNITTKRSINPWVIALGIAVIVLLVLLFAGCSTKTSIASDPQASSAVAPPTQTPPPVNEYAKHFGETITWADGSSISVSDPSPFVPTEYAAGLTPGTTPVVFEIVYTNNTDKPYDPIMWPQVSSGGVESTSISDLSNSLGQVGFVPTTTVLPGQTVKWYQAFSVADPSNITLVISPDSFGEKGIFTNIPF